MTDTNEVSLAQWVMRDFDIRALHAALDAERHAKGFTWAALTREITGPQRGAISASSFSGMADRGAVNGNVVMAALRWLDRTPESFVPDHPDASTRKRLPKNLPQRFMGRWKLKALHDALEAERSERQLTWKEVAREIGVSSSTLAGYAKKDTLVTFPAVLRVTGWLGRPVTDFIERDS